MTKRTLSFWTFLTGLLFTGLVHVPYGVAEQLDFQLSPSEAFIGYSYKWQDGFSKEHNISFDIPREDVIASAKDFYQMDIEHLRKRIHQAVQRYAKGYKKRMQLQVSFDDKDQLVVYGAFKSEGERDRMITALENLRSRTAYDFMEENMLTSGPYQQLVPDVARAAAESAPALAPLAQKMASQLGDEDIRTIANYTLGFVQSIPMDKKTAAPFTLPVSTLTLNNAREESKAALFAAIMRALNPKLKMITLHLKDRTYVGISMPNLDGDYTFQVRGLTFVMADPGAHKLLSIGEVSQRAESRDTYTYFEIPRAKN